MADTPKRFFVGYVPTLQTSVYTTPAATRALIKGMRFNNGSSQDVQVTVWIGGTTDDYIVYDELIVGKGSDDDDGFIVAEPTEQIYWRASLANAISARASGMEST